MQRGQGVGSEYVEGGQRVGGEWAESVLVRGVFGSKKGSFLGIGLISKYFLFWFFVVVARYFI